MGKLILSEFFLLTPFLKVPGERQFHFDESNFLFGKIKEILNGSYLPPGLLKLIFFIAWSISSQALSLIFTASIISLGVFCVFLLNTAAIIIASGSIRYMILHVVVWSTILNSWHLARWTASVESAEDQASHQVEAGATGSLLQGGLPERRVEFLLRLQARRGAYPYISSLV